MKVSEWRERLERERKQKDWFFAVNPRSPIPPGSARISTGSTTTLRTQTIRFELKLHEYEEKKTLKMACAQVTQRVQR